MYRTVPIKYSPKFVYVIEPPLMPPVLSVVEAIDTGTVDARQLATVVDVVVVVAVTITCCEFSRNEFKASSKPFENCSCADVT